jgi:hypothetical protein
MGQAESRYWAARSGPRDPQRNVIAGPAVYGPRRNLMRLRRCSGLLQNSLVNADDFVIGQDEDHFVDPIVIREELSRRVHSDLRRFRNRISISTAVDRWKRYRLDSVFNRELQRASIATRQSLWFTAFPAGPKRTDGVNDETSG